jgi:FkbM family methyltransferase
LSLIQKKKSLDLHFFLYIISTRFKSGSQINADLIPGFFEYLGVEIPKTFIEAGASDGVINSNTLLLEQSGFTGVLVEPNPYFQNSLRENRSANVEFKALGENSEILVKYTNPVDKQLTSAIQSKPKRIEFKPYKGMIKKSLNLGDTFSSQTISFMDLLKKYELYEVGFFSLDIEGQELEILNSIDFSIAHIFIICCEHNYRRDRLAVKTLLYENGYTLILRKYSGQDYWFAKSDLVSKYLDS